MIKTKITKNIFQEHMVFMGLTLKQLIFGIAGFALGGAEIYFLINKIPMDALMTLVFFTILIFVAVGVVRINGMSTLKFVMLAFKGTDKRPYHSKGVFSTDEKNKNTF
jgi:hypothetical protein